MAKLFNRVKGKVLPEYATTGAFPTASAQLIGAMVTCSADSKNYVCTGSAWTEVGGGSSLPTRTPDKTVIVGKPVGGGGDADSITFSSLGKATEYVKYIYVVVLENGTSADLPEYPGALVQKENNTGIGILEEITLETVATVDYYVLKIRSVTQEFEVSSSNTSMHIFAPADPDKENITVDVYLNSITLPVAGPFVDGFHVDGAGRHKTWTNSVNQTVKIIIENAFDISAGFTSIAVSENIEIVGSGSTYIHPPISAKSSSPGSARITGCMLRGFLGESDLSATLGFPLLQLDSCVIDTLPTLQLLSSGGSYGYSLANRTNAFDMGFVALQGSPGTVLGRIYSSSADKEMEQADENDTWVNVVTDMETAVVAGTPMAIYTAEASCMKIYDTAPVSPSPTPNNGDFALDIATNAIVHWDTAGSNWVTSVDLTTTGTDMTIYGSSDSDLAYELQEVRVEEHDAGGVSYTVIPRTGVVYYKVGTYDQGGDWSGDGCTKEAYYGIRGVPYGPWDSFGCMDFSDFLLVTIGNPPAQTYVGTNEIVVTYYQTDDPIAPANGAYWATRSAGTEGNVCNSNPMTVLQYSAGSSTWSVAILQPVDGDIIYLNASGEEVAYVKDGIYMPKNMFDAPTYKTISAVASSRAKGPHADSGDTTAERNAIILEASNCTFRTLYVNCVEAGTSLLRTSGGTLYGGYYKRTSINSLTLSESSEYLPNPLFGYRSSLRRCTSDIVFKPGSMFDNTSRLPISALTLSYCNFATVEGAPTAWAIIASKISSGSISVRHTALINGVDKLYGSIYSNVRFHVIGVGSSPTAELLAEYRDKIFSYVTGGNALPTTAATLIAQNEDGWGVKHTVSSANSDYVVSELAGGGLRMRLTESDGGRGLWDDSVAIGSTDTEAVFRRYSGYDGDYIYMPPSRVMRLHADVTLRSDDTAAVYELDATVISDSTGALSLIGTESISEIARSAAFPLTPAASGMFELDLTTDHQIVIKLTFLAPGASVTLEGHNLRVIPRLTY